MIIKRLTAVFGGLGGKTLELTDGLNIIYAPNESGKTTWCAFIKAMLYGISTSEKRKGDFIPDKTKYLPWSGGAMEGVVEIEFGGRTLRLQRTGTEKHQMGNTVVTDTATGEKLSGITGETLTGVTKGVFESSAFIGSAGMRVRSNSELERLISGIVSSGEETVSYSETAETLSKWQKKRLSKKQDAEIPRLEKRIQTLEGQLEAMKASSSRISNLEDDKKRAEKLRRKARERAEYELRLSEAQSRVDSAQEELNGLGDLLGKNPVNEMNRAEAEKAAGDFRSVGRLLTVLIAAAVLISAALAVFFGWLLAIAALAVFAVLIIITARRRNRAGKILAGLGTTDSDKLRRAFDEVEELKTRITVSRRRVSEEKKNLDAIKASDGSYDGPTAEAAEKAYEQVLTALAAENAKLNNYGDPVVTECELGQCRERLEKARREYAAIETAIEALGQANETVRSRFSPALTRRAGEIMAELTGGRYDALSFNREFDAEARVNGDAIFRDALSLSTGTLDQLYLALRLAIAELALDSEEACPIILDDALLSFDDERMAAALTMLERMSEKRQIILFTCHSREKKWLETR